MKAMSLEERRNLLLKTLEDNAPEGQHITPLSRFMMQTCDEAQFALLLEKLPKWAKELFTVQSLTEISRRIKAVKR